MWNQYFNRLWLLNLGVLMAFLSGCGGGADTGLSNDRLATTVEIQGEVIAAPNGEWVEGVEIFTQEEGVLARTDAQGRFALRLPTGATRTLRLRKDGYARQSLLVSVGNEAQELSITLLRRGPVVRIANAENGFEYTDPQGARVIIPPNSLVYRDIQGTEQPVIGEVLLQVTSVDVSSNDELGAFPGRFAGTDISDNSAEAILSYGTVEFVFTLPDGTAVNLASGATEATIEIPVFVDTHPDGTRIAVGDKNQAIWSFDEKTGLWKQESNAGEIVPSNASPTGMALRAMVTHFSWWNYDIKAQTCMQPITIQGLPSGAVVKLQARTVINGWPRFATREVAYNGNVVVLLPAGRVELEATVQDGDLFYLAGPITIDACLRDANDAIPAVVLDLRDRMPSIRRFDAVVIPVFGQNDIGQYVVVANDVLLRMNVLGAAQLVLADQTTGTSSLLLPRQRLARTTITADTTFQLVATNSRGQVSQNLSVAYVSTSAPVVRSAYVTRDGGGVANTYTLVWDVDGADMIRYGYIDSSAPDLIGAFEVSQSVLQSTMVSITLPDSSVRDVFVEFGNTAANATIVRRFRVGDPQGCVPEIPSEFCGPQ